ncbi:MAG TPA: ferrochelatase [Acidimicrobiales bacterium]|nr:ferrochelatase [Acidimicrobiales bacterium]
MRFDAVLVLSFGGPERPEDVLPFLQNVVAGRDVPPARLEQVAAQYMRMGGRSPINDQNRALVAALGDALGRPVYWGNRNWEPYVEDVVAAMAADGVESAAVFVTSAYSSYSGCGQYLEDLARAARAAGAAAPRMVKLRPFFDHPGFVGPLAEGLVAADPGGAPVLMTAHSIPLSMARRCDYEAQLATTVSLVAGAAGVDPARCTLVYQSRSGPPSQPWLGPDIVEALPEDVPEVVVVPVGFVSDHMEVVHDLDVVAAEAAAARGLRLVRTPTPGTHPRFVQMVGELVDELESGSPPWPVPCRPGCCDLTLVPPDSGRPAPDAGAGLA